MRQAIFKVGGHTFGLSRVRFGIHSEETIDFMADLFCDGKPIACVSNDGHGGATSCYPHPDADMEYYRAIRDEVGKYVWLVCRDGTTFFHDLGTVADECLYNGYDIEKILLG